MPYQPTGKPSGRPKNKLEDDPHWRIMVLAHMLLAVERKSVSSNRQLFLWLARNTLPHGPYIRDADLKSNRDWLVKNPADSADLVEWDQHKAWLGFLQARERADKQLRDWTFGEILADPRKLKILTNATREMQAGPTRPSLPGRAMSLERKYYRYIADPVVRRALDRMVDEHRGKPVRWFWQ